MHTVPLSPGIEMFELVYWSLLRFHFHASKRLQLRRSSSTEEDMEDEREADGDHGDRAAVSKPSSMRPKEDFEASRAAGKKDGGSSVIADDNAGGVGNAIRSGFRGKMGGVNGENDVEEDSAEEGAVDEHVDDLTFFDDATQPEGTDPDWD